MVQPTPLAWASSSNLATQTWMLFLFMASASPPPGALPACLRLLPTPHRPLTHLAPPGPDTAALPGERFPASVPAGEVSRTLGSPFCPLFTPLHFSRLAVPRDQGKRAVTHLGSQRDSTTARKSMGRQQRWGPLEKCGTDGNRLTQRGTREAQDVRDKGRSPEWPRGQNKCCRELAQEEKHGEEWGREGGRDPGRQRKTWETAEALCAERWQQVPWMAGWALTLVVALYSSTVLVRLSVWRARWENTKPAEARPRPPEAEATHHGTGWGLRGDSQGRVASRSHACDLRDTFWPLWDDRLGADVHGGPHLGEDGVPLANEAFALIELPLPRKEPICLQPAGCPGLGPTTPLPGLSLAPL